MRFRQIAHLALAAIRRRDGDAAWLLADRLCRLGDIPAADALLLRAIAHSLRGDRAAATADLAAAAHADPLSPAVNRALLAAPERTMRRAAARRLLGATDPSDREHGYAALFREGLRAVGTVEIEDGHLAGTLAWTGAPRLALDVRTDLGVEAVRVEPSGRPAPGGFDHVADLMLPRPGGARIVALAAAGLESLFEPATLLLPPTAPAREPAPAIRPPGSLLIVIPVHDDAAATMACFDSLLAALPAGCDCRIVAIDDVTPDPALGAWLDRLAATGAIELLRNRLNMGFAGSVNRALAGRSPGEDVLLLNADTIVPPGAIERLARHARSQAGAGTVTPLSNNGEDTSFPLRFRVNPLPDAASITAIDAVASRVNAGVAVDIPNGVGFCLYIRGDVLDAVGPLSQAFGRGYYEDVEFCLRAAASGFRNLCATDVYVGHHGGRSFGGEKRALVAGNLRRLALAYPRFRDEARAFERSDPLRAPIARIEEERLRLGPGIDLVIIPQAVPAALADALAAAVRRPDILLVVARTDGLRIDLAAMDGASPQTIAWTMAEGGSDADLRLRLSALPLRAVTLVDAATLPAGLVRAVSSLAVTVRLVAADPLAEGPAGRPLPFVAVERRAVTEAVARLCAMPCPALDYPPLAALRTPRLDLDAGTVAILMDDPGPADIALLDALESRLAGTALAPSIVVAGLPDDPGRLSSCHGRIEPSAIPDWLDRVGPRAILFASARWGIADPRRALWSGAGLAIAWFDPSLPSATCDGPGLAITAGADPRSAAQAIAAWLSPARPTPHVERIPSVMAGHHVFV